MKAIVWGSTFQSASRKLDEIEEQYKRYETTPLLTKRKNNRRHELVFANGDYWMACTAKESARALKCNISYIDARIDKDFVDLVIKHCTTLGPYTATHYY